MKSPKVLLFSAPLCFAVYGVIRLFGRADGRYGPGLDWQAAHLVGLLGMLLFVPAVIGLERRLPQGNWRTGATFVALAGLAATIVQFGADITFAALAEDKTEMSRLSRDFSAIPGVRPAFYTVGPPLFFLGLIVLTVLLVRAGRLPRWSPVVLTISTVLPMVTLDLIPLAGLGILASFRALRDAPDGFEPTPSAGHATEKESPPHRVP